MKQLKRKTDQTIKVKIIMTVTKYFSRFFNRVNSMDVLLSEFYSLRHLYDESILKRFKKVQINLISDTMTQRHVMWVE